MDESSEYGLTGTGKPPWWFARSARLKNLWENPIFQRAYKRNRIRSYISQGTAFWGAFGLSFVICAASIFAHMRYTVDDVTLWGTVLVLVPGGLLVYTVYILLYISCLITTPLNLARDLGKDEMNPVMSTPLTDKDFYYGESLPGFIKSMGVVQTVMSLIVGLIIPFVFFILVPAGWINLDHQTFIIACLLVFIGAPIWLAMFVLDLALMALLISLASGLYAFRLPTAGAIFAALVHYWIISGVAGIFTGGMSSMMFGYGMVAPLVTPGVIPSWSILLIVGGYIFQKAMLIGGCLITANIGVSSYGAKRRGGINYRR